MNPPMTINSTNSVSTTRRKREAERSVNWTVEETQVLLCAWSDERVQKSLAENLRNRHVFKHLSARMSEMGFARSPHQCRLRVKTLKANYVRAKLQRSVGGSPQQCTFKYFAEMDAVLGRRSAGGEGDAFFGSSGPMEDGADRTGSLPQDFNSLQNAEIAGLHFAPLGRAGKQRSSCAEARAARQAWQLHPEVKMEEREDSTDEFELTDAGFSECPRDRSVYLDSTVHPDLSGSPVENGFDTPSPHGVHPPASPPPPPLTRPAASPLPAPPDPNALGSPGPEPVLKHLLESFQRLVSDTRGLLGQLESQRQGQARWHRELLAQWLEREERRQRETDEREERREKARMEHEIRVLELLAGLGRAHGCKCGGSRGAGPGPGAGPEAATGHNTDKNRN